MKFVQPGRRDIGAGRFHAFTHGELLAEIGRRLMVYVVVVADPASLPVPGPHHAGLERRDPGRGARVVLVPDRHGPVIPGERVEFRPGVTDEHPVRIRAPRIPHVAASGGHGGGIPPHDDPVSPLERPGTAVVQTPAQSRRRGVDAQRRLQMFAPQPHGRTRSGGNGTRRVPGYRYGQIRCPRPQGYPVRRLSAYGDARLPLPTGIAVPARRHLWVRG